MPITTRFMPLHEAVDVPEWIIAKDRAFGCGAHADCYLERVASLHRLPVFTKDGAVHVVVECPRGSAVKLKWEPKLGVMTLSRTLPHGVVYPFDFGFIPSTLAEDGDPLDAMIVCDAPTFPGVVVGCRPIGVFRASQKGEGKKKRVRNDRVIFVAASDRRGGDLKDVSDLPARAREELEAFFIASVALEDKELEVLGWGDVREARAAVERSRR
jgi:inorganic pyrophosphatase